MTMFSRFSVRRVLNSEIIRSCRLNKQPLLSQVTRRALSLKHHGDPTPAVGTTTRVRNQSFGNTKRIALVSLIGGFSIAVYNIYHLNNPREQLQPDPSKKTLVILGTGWGSTSLLKEIDSSNYNVVVISSRNYFLFTPLLPSCVTGLLDTRSLMEPIRNILRHKTTAVKFYDAEATNIDYEKRVVHFKSDSTDASAAEIPFDLLVVGVGAENATFGIAGVKEHACFLKETKDAEKIHRKVMARVEQADFKGQGQEEIKRLLHMVVVGGGPTGIETAAELQDFFKDDLKKCVPELADKLKVTLIEALPTVLPMFSKKLINLTESTFQEENIVIRKRTMVKSVSDTEIEVECRELDGTVRKEVIPYGVLIWAGGNAVRPIVRDFMGQFPGQSTAHRGLVVDDYLRVKGASGVWALGDCTQTNFAPTAQVASQQGVFLGKHLNAIATAKNHSFGNIAGDVGQPLLGSKAAKAFDYIHQGSLAYIGNERAIADIPLLGMNIASGGQWTFLFWRLAYVKMCLSVRNRYFVMGDWLRVQLFGRDISSQ
ncbi:External alternative NADH-ubiquinone oxidoreductase mitochondrial [Penicillium concentricum]|uniref:NADH:ubiquinone reductase (non-electrogenic) n=1 Tax=Penicillium concentricum TaxID=293559 RepID=A0A9W9RK61_9EURO|nr:External alternative NADH-ubiquinone oxidoreductase mitochondrial [Penicillium concentricum]KAJ5360349.1 External alternative NADH-ubiquinone oxidoreductase mitochondrial [Penicillium concentricum]